MMMILEVCMVMMMEEVEFYRYVFDAALFLLCIAWSKVPGIP
jgi:hypothetical protein